MTAKVLSTCTACLLVASLAAAEDVFCRKADGSIATRKTCKADETRADITDADEKMVAACQYVGDFHGGSSFWGTAFAGALGTPNATMTTSRSAAAQENTRKDIRKQAAEKGATHVVWTQAGGRGYRCEAEK